MQTSDIDHIIQAITQQGYAISPHFLPDATIQQLAEYARQLELAGNLKPAGTGSEANLQANNKIRGDYIFWLQDNDPAPCVQAYMLKMKALQQQLNQQLFLNLYELEAHLAIYPPGTGYAKHLDQFNQGRNALRQVSCVLYLNQGWQEGFGGQLRLYLADGNTQEIMPTGGTLVTFMSGEFIHEVLPATQPRISLTGWFRRRDDRLI